MKLILAILSVLCGACYVSGKPTMVVKFGAVNQYLAYGSGSVLDKDPAAQTLLLALYDNGFNWSIWNHNDFQGWNKSLGTEIDYGFGWSGKIAPYTNLSISMTYFDEPRILKFGAGDIVFGQAAVSRSIFGITGTIQYEKYVTMPKSGFTGGDLYSLGLSKKLSPDDMVSITNSLALVYDDGGFGFDRGYLIRGVLTIDWKVSKRLTLTIPQVYYYAPFAVHDSRKRNMMVYCGISYTL